MTALGEAVRELLTEAGELYRDSPAASAALAEQAHRMRQPLRIAVTGQQGIGKSTLVNALVGERVAPLACPDGRSVPAWYTDGQQAQATVRAAGGEAVPLPVSRHGDGPAIDLGSWDADRVDHVEVAWPARTLREVILIDTPAPGPREDAASAARRVAARADAVVHLARQPHGADLRSLWAWRSGPFAASAPLPVLLVLARADALGAGRVDALTASRQLARRYRGDDRLRSLCGNVLAVSALLADAGRRLSDPEYTALATLAAVPKQTLEPTLLSADRFANAAPAESPTPEERRWLLDRFGIAGLRLAVTLVRQRCDSRAALAAELTERSGLTDLRDSLGADLVAHRDLVKARSALVALDEVLRARPRPAAAPLAARVERLLAGAHEFRELRLLTALRTGGLSLPESWRPEAERLAGGYGETLAERLELAAETPPDAVRSRLTDALARWRDRSGNPVVTAPQRTAAATLARTCERLVAAPE